jgi:heme-degrading monooxygenase HmoA
VFVSITRLRVRSVWFLPGFIVYAARSARQARNALGNLGVELLRDAHNAFWTRTAWQDEAAMRAFMMAMPHRSAMGKLAEWCDEASVAHWNQETADLPDWQEAHRRMIAEGRPSRVRHPSAEHEKLQIPPPKG